MQITVTPTDEETEGPTPATMDVAFEVEFTAAGHRREDGLTAAEVEEEMRLNDGS